MKILFINELFGTKRQGGQEIASKNLINGLRKQKFNLEERTLSGADNTNKIKVPLPKVFIESPYLREMIGFPVVGRFFLRNLKDVTIIHSTSPSLFAIAKPNQPLVLTVHGIKSEKALRLKSMKILYRLLFNPFTIWWLKLTERRGLQKAAAIIVLTKRTRQYIIKALGIDDFKVKIIPNGVDTSRFNYQPTQKASAIFVGRVTPPKGIEPLLRAVEKYSLDLTIVASRISPEYLMKAKKLGINIIRNVPHNKLADIYHQASVFVLPSFDEEQPLTVLEAMACGLPVVTTAIGSGGVVIDNLNGLIVRPQTDEIGLALTKLFNDKKLSIKFGQQSRAIAEQHSWTRVIDEYRQVYNSLVFKGSGRIL